MGNVYEKNIVEFVTVAVEFCAFLEQTSEKSYEHFTQVVQKLLPLLYLKASLVEKPVFIGDDDLPSAVGEAEYERVRSAITAKLGGNDDYYNGEQGGSISECLADCYQSVKDFVMIYKEGDQQASSDALSNCMDDFEHYWGARLIEALGALHSVIYNDKTDEHDGSVPSQD
ncbi:MAG: DUF5063 domain-containing protein [Paludibacteraceae bacterium]|nr:DUF5063 domain-containing protein [Paludibacteraceae bacterium]